MKLDPHSFRAEDDTLVLSIFKLILYYETSTQMADDLTLLHDYEIKNTIQKPFIGSILKLALHSFRCLFISQPQPKWHVI